MRKWSTRIDKNLYRVQQDDNFDEQDSSVMDFNDPLLLFSVVLHSLSLLLTIISRLSQLLKKKVKHDSVQVLPSLSLATIDEKD